MTNDGRLKIWDQNETQWAYVGAGEQGAAGDTGQAGDTGAGVQGDTGVQGVAGDTGASVQGDTGIQGDTGADSTVAGDTGAQGDTGTAGAKGDTGTAGAAGDTGATGSAGDTGVQGDTGVIPGTLTAELDLGENYGLVLDSALSADGKYSGIVRAGTAGAALAFGELCYLDPTDSRWELVDANAAAAADGDARGLLGICVLAAAGDGNATKMLLWGVVRADAQFPTFTVNGSIYASETAGEVTTTQPTTTDAVIRVVGVGTTTDEMFFNPNGHYFTHT